jgi:uncharacterized protein YjbI with pentapeptide repeats/energy-coupling factor transporter ATP-binding protein EcfA2
MSSHTDERAAEVFPWMEHTIVICALIGAVVAVVLGRASQLESSGVVLGGMFGAAAGAAVGICLALLWAAETPASPARPSDLWDPWLDAADSTIGADPPPTHSSEEAAFEIAARVNRSRARVKPRVIAAETGEALPLEDLIGPILASAESGAIRISGRSGSGKTTALAHLSGLVPPHLNVSFLENPHPRALVSAVGRGWAVFTSDNASLRSAEQVDLRLAPWGNDEWIEYLLATDHRLCASVMARLELAKAEATRLDGIPELWRLVLDRMVANPSLAGPRCVLKSELAALLPEPELRGDIETACFLAVSKKGADSVRYIRNVRPRLADEWLLRLIRHRPVQLLLAADSIVHAIKNRADREALSIRLPRDLVHEAASRIAEDAEAVDRLHSLIARGDRKLHPMVASLLHASHDGWIPDRPPPRLAGAYLENASWPDIDLAGADMVDVDLSGADLQRSRLDSAIFEGANLTGANLYASSMQSAKFDRADLSRASLANVRARECRFSSAQLVAANLAGADLERANFVGADLSQAQLIAASLVEVDLRSAKLEASDFSRANLSGAEMSGLTLGGAQFAGACFRGARLSRCNLEGMHMPGASFEGADLRHALLTGSQMHGANFRGALLRGTGLAEIDWEGADLRGADLREATFHLGSCRSGLVGSPIASEGSRTGFYTDDWNEQDFKSPEEIRKANLCGADLRGARIENVDFYLVDLRGALLGPEQVVHIRRCGAILETRA